MIRNRSEYFVLINTWAEVDNYKTNKVNLEPIFGRFYETKDYQINGVIEKLKTVKNHAPVSYFCNVSGADVPSIDISRLKNYFRQNYCKLLSAAIKYRLIREGRWKGRWNQLANATNKWTGPDAKAPTDSFTWSQITRRKWSRAAAAAVIYHPNKNNSIAAFRNIFI